MEDSMATVTWLIGAILTAVTVVGGFIVRDRQVAKLIADGDERIRGELEASKASTKEDFDNLHERVNKVREGYVRRDDLDTHLQRMGDDIKDMRGENREATKAMNERLDAVLAALSKQK